MKHNLLKVLALFLINCNPGISWAQYSFFEPKEGFAIEVSLPNSNLKRLPIDRNSISSLIVIDDYIIGGTSAKEGLSPFIFVASLSERKLLNFKDVDEVVSGQRSILSGYCLGKGRVIYAGTMANGKNEGGHLIRINVGPDASIYVEDLGIPVPGEGIFTLLSDDQGDFLYGVSHPSGKFFQYNVNDGQVKVYDDIAPRDEDLELLGEYSLTPEQYLCKALVQDDQGFIYGSMPVNKLFYFDTKNETFHILDNELPDVWGRRTMGQAESWAKSKDGILYGGNAGDGQLFMIDPATKKVKNLGKPIMMNRLRGLTFARDGKLYGIAGSLPGYSHLFSYDADGDGFVDLGNPEFTMVAPGIEQGIKWRGFQLGTIASSANGKYIVMGEDETLSQLLIFAVEE